jgi:type IV pilus assembly protein PilM
MIGIDFSERHIKVIQLSKLAKNRFALEAGGVSEMPKGTFLTENKEKLLEVAESLKKVLAESHVTVKEAAFALPEASVFFTTLTIPQVPEDKLAEVIALEARRFVPFPIEKVELDWQVINTDPKTKKATVFVACALKNVVEKYRQIAELAGVDLKVLEVQAMALQRSLVPPNYGEPLLILEWGENNLNLIILEEGLPQFGRRLSLGSKLLDQVIAKQLKIDLVKAKNLKEQTELKGSIAPGLTLEQVVTKELAQVVNGVKQALRLFESQSNKQVKIMLVSGGGALLKGLSEYFQIHLPELKIHRADPWLNIEIDPALKPKLEKTAPQYAVAVGLAKR